MVCPPAFVPAKCLRDSISTMATAHGSMMLESVLTDHVHQLWKIEHLDDSARAKCIERIVGEFALAYVSIDLAC